MTGLPKVLEALPDFALYSDEAGPHAEAGLETGSKADPGADPEADSSAPRALGSLQEALGYRFAQPGLLRVAVTLGSWANEHASAGWPSNACLEFFGDAVLDLVAADALWIRFPELAEGELTRLRATLVAERSLVGVAESLELGAYLYLGKGDLKRGGRTHASTLADAVEAVLGAVFLDARVSGRGAMEEAAAVFECLLGDALRALQPSHGLDPKSRLQHWAQSRYRVTPTYVRSGDKSSPGEPRWRARVELHHRDGRVEVLGEGEARSLKAAERQAAEQALATLDTGPAVTAGPQVDPPVADGS